MTVLKGTPGAADAVRESMRDEPTAPDTRPNAKSTPEGGRSKRYTEKHRHIRGRGLVASTALGLADGLVTNLSFLTGFGGAVASVSLIQFAGMASMFAGATSMFFGGFLSARSESALYEADSKREAYEIENELEEERAEMLDLYRGKGLTQEEAEIVVTRISSDKARFLEDMLLNELHISKSALENPLRIGAAIGIAFLVGAFVPLLPYYIISPKAQAVTASVILSAAFLFGAGAWKGRTARKSTWRSGLETLLIGAAATALLFLIGSASKFV
jgi:predicted membrane protein (TIGR00267 family)